jgi:hypothetical protein
MALKIETFSNAAGGGNSLFKALGHPASTPLAIALLDQLAAHGPIAIYDPEGFAGTVDEFLDLSRLTLAGYYVQNAEKVGDVFRGHVAEPVTALPKTQAAAVFLLLFDGDRAASMIRHLVPDGVPIFTLDLMRLPDALLTDKGRYLSPLNFATNFAFFRDAGGLHTRIVTANYWGSYSQKPVKIAFRLFGEDGQVLAVWDEDLTAPGGTVVVDSRDVKARFHLGDFTGQLLLHVVGAAGHDIVKYALDTYSDDGNSLSCTHDANAWPADFYAGLPAPADGEKVVLWVQNSHPVPIPAGAIGLNEMGSAQITWLDQAIPPFASYALDVAALLPDLRWPRQIEIQAGRYVVRPRYEIVHKGTDGQVKTRISHPNVERTDLVPDPKLPQLTGLFGKGYILPGPVLPLGDFTTRLLPTPMATCQTHLPVKAVLYDAAGQVAGEHRFGNLPRRHDALLDLDQFLAAEGKSLSTGFGHLELLYDFDAGALADGWLHALFRYQSRTSGHAAESSFGAHIFNTALTYKGEPQSYAGRPPGLSTRLFLRLGDGSLDTICHLIYPTSTPWYDLSDTALILMSGDGQEVARQRVQIRSNGSLFWRYKDMFSAEDRKAAGANPYILIRDVTCRLFGYHGLTGPGGTFSLDHMFGF